MNEKYRGKIGSMEGRTEIQYVERGLDKTAIKKRLHDLFARGMSPENITLEQISEAFGLPIPTIIKDKKKVVDAQKLALNINNQVRKLFPSLNRKEAIAFQYKLFKEEKGEKE
jgi:hypothetical protein